jgi:cytochrome P450
MLVLLREPELMAAIRDDPARAEPFIEEVLRYDTPVPGVFRIATRDATVGGVPVKKGDKIMVIYGSANHDEAHWECPAEFRPDREFEIPHLGFGTGVHYCPGASLARLEGRVAVQEVLRRMGNIRFAPGNTFPYVPSVIQRIPIRLHLLFEKLA